MRFLKNLIKINDLCFISTKLKNINKNFELFFNTKNHFFEVHNTSKDNSFVITFSTYPNENLLLKLQKTRSSNKNIFKEIEESNKKTEEKNNEILNDKVSDYFKEICNFAERNTSNISQNQIKKIIEKG